MHELIPNWQKLDARELGAILAGLRLLQRSRPLDTDILDIATNGDEHKPLNTQEIDELCERLNCGEEQAHRVHYALMAFDGMTTPQVRRTGKAHAGKLTEPLLAADRAVQSLDLLAGQVIDTLNDERVLPPATTMVTIAELRRAAEDGKSKVLGYLNLMGMPKEGN